MALSPDIFKATFTMSGTQKPGGLESAFRGIPDHTPSVSRHTVTRLFRPLPRNGETVRPVLRDITIVDFKGKIHTLESSAIKNNS